MSSPDTSNPQVPAEPKRVAVVAFHGVGEHPPGSSARQISDLLANLESSYASVCPMLKQLAPSCYSTFDEEPIAIAVQPVRIVHTQTQRRGGIAGPFQAIAKDFATTFSEPPHTPTDEQDHSFMRSQLQDYKVQNAEKTYRTVRLRGSRRLAASGQESRVDVYELYWKDLSSLGLGVATIFGEMYQILFHLTSLGCQAVRGTWIENPTVRSWAVFVKLQTWASLCLTVPIALINLFMLAIALDLGISSIFTQFGSGVQLLTVYVLVWIIFLVLTGMLFLHSRRPAAFGIWIVPILLFAAALLLCMIPSTGLWKLPDLSGLPTVIANARVQVFAVLVLAVTIELVAKIIQAYDRQRPGVARPAFYSRHITMYCNLAPDCDFWQRLWCLQFTGLFCFGHICGVHRRTAFLAVVCLASVCRPRFMLSSGWFGCRPTNPTHGR
jgi:hypothetical protein